MYKKEGWKQKEAGGGCWEELRRKGWWDEDEGGLGKEGEWYVEIDGGGCVRN